METRINELEKRVTALEKKVAVETTTKVSLDDKKVSQELINAIEKGIKDSESRRRQFG
ncbi:hypothetical protein [Pueribacillus sp. YX66]|uniref:hypothetical protein n=1 Tax=Pueribacillus sp. YX66 TaxID=3229242 RepID=UPI00358D8907